jgi:MFS family permease
MAGRRAAGGAGVPEAAEPATHGPGSLSTPRPTAFDAIRNPYLRAFAFGQMASAMAAQFVSVAVGWELWERTGDPWALGLVGLFEVLPVFALMLPAGNAADRFVRRNVSIAAYTLLATACCGLTYVSWRQAPVEIVYGLLMLIGGARAFATPSVESLLPQIVDRRLLASAQGWLISSWQVASISGPALVGFLIAGLGAATWTYLIAAGLELLFVGMLLTFPAVAPRPATGRRTVTELFGGLAFIRRNPIFLAAITLDLFGVLLGGAVALLPIFAKDILEVGPSGLGILRAAPALGALLAALAVSHLPPWQHPGRVLLLVVAGFGLATVGFGLSTNVYLSVACLFLTGAFDSVSMVIRETLQLMLTPDHLRGRVRAVEHMFIGFSNELGAFESGAVAALFGPIISVVSGGIGTVVVVAVVALAWPALARIGPLHTLKPLENPLESDARASERSSQRTTSPARA